MSSNKRSLVPCPHCGEMIRADAKACPHCGSDERTGWSEGTYMDGLDLPDDIDYEDVLEKEFGAKDTRKPWLSWRLLLGILFLLLLLFGYLKRLL